LKVLTHRPRYIEPVVIPKFDEGASSAAKTEEIAPPAQKTEKPALMLKLPFVKLVETTSDKTEGSKIEEIPKIPEILSPSIEATVPKVQKSSTATPKRRRMANVLDVVLETTKILSPAPTRKTAEASKAQPRTETKQAEVETTTIQAKTEAGPSVPPEKEPAVIEEKATEQIAFKKVETLAPEASKESIDYIIRHASGKGLSQEEKLEALHYAQKLKYLKGALVFNGSGEEDFLYCLPDNKEISVCREIGRSIRFPKLEDGLSILSKDKLADSLAYNSIKVYELYLNLIMGYFICHTYSFLHLQGLILSNALRAQKNIEDEGYTMALNNLRSEVIELRNEGLEKDKILISLVNKVKEDEASFKAQTEIQKNEIEDLWKQLAEAKEKCALAEANRESSEYWKNYLEKTVEELCASKERCFKKSLGCVEKIKASFANVGAYSNEDNFIRGDPEGVIEWISGEAEAFKEILSDRGDVCTFSGARGISAILEKAGCDHVKTLAQAEDAFCVDDTKDPSAEASLIGGKFYNDIWVNGG
jgi:hypothetical protein